MMFRGLISRDLGDPWPHHGLDTAGWLEQPVRYFLITDLTATQDGIHLHPLIWPHPPMYGDPYPHVVVHGGHNYLEDGHTRAMKAMLNQQPTLACRWIAPQGDR